jgi:hypothetical protein
MVGRTDDNSVDVVAIQDLAIVAHGLSLMPNRSHGRVATQLIDIAGGDDFVSRKAIQELGQVHASPAGADQADAYAVVCAERAATR